MNNLIVISEEVKKAFSNNIGVVSLESTIISHGMPYPKNVETAIECCNIIRNNGCVPACIAIIGGVIKVGLTLEEIDYIGKRGSLVLKTSSRDIPYVVSKKLDGATTVSATSKISTLAGINVFATGGIGGVHRDYLDTMDVSSDLEELGDNPICCVCSGIKSILDLGKTIEYLETKRVEVIGYNTSSLPAFYNSSSKYFVNHRLDTPEEISNLLKTKLYLNINSGTLVCNPIPKEFEVDENIINEAIEKALVEMKIQNITGNKTTPFLLKRISEITNNFSLESNIKLVYNNALLASKIAKSLKK